MMKMISPSFIRLPYRFDLASSMLLMSHHDGLEACKACHGLCSLPTRQGLEAMIGGRCAHRLWL